MTTYIVVGVVIVVIIGLIALFRASRNIGVSSVTLTVPLNGSITFTAQLLYKSWALRRFKPIRGTIKITSTPIKVQVLPITFTTVRPSRMATFTVNGLVLGSQKINLSGNSRKGGHDAAVIDVTVVAPPAPGTPPAGGGSTGSSSTGG